MDEITDLIKSTFGVGQDRFHLIQTQLELREIMYRLKSGQKFALNIFFIAPSQKSTIFVRRLSIFTSYLFTIHSSLKFGVDFAKQSVIVKVNRSLL